MKKLAAFVLLLALAAFIAGGLVIGSWKAAGPANKAIPVVVAQGSSLRKAAETLEVAGALESADNFLLLARIFGGDGTIHAGEYEIPARASPADILALLQSGKTLQRFITVPEGLPSIMVHERLMAAPTLAGTVPVPEEGSVLPDSYSYQRGESRAAVLKRMQDAMTKELDALWAKRQPQSVAKSKREAIILASVVEKETGKPSERRMVAGVYSNRVRLGMKLDADPTVIYPITKGKPLGRRIRRSELNDDNGYNTYARPGLPAGPIANPGRESIAAVLNPADTQALYFVADGTGGHVFANSLSEHNANVAKWYAIRRARGEM
ncbi:endolytic transglycosylase MltG [Sphingosinicella rhizophila]|uniref:Endolytic murein transglycosylase n=1 Tax=Sphingosinicella rhizophila TaxID=3050082 RepID=A0ABU3Q353_9SPHN|nr:endolytic transglycosylase MltG [Sphingosinicella sp. GR2756]MDT9597836.1 endolytic transglycosylase MltG [Sphingosinicella sp. GR2756]